MQLPLVTVVAREYEVPGGLRLFMRSPSQSSATCTTSKDPSLLHSPLAQGLVLDHEAS